MSGGGTTAQRAWVKMRYQVGAGHSMKRTPMKRQIVGSEIVPSAKARRLCLGIVVVLILFAMFCAYVTHGWLWSAYTPIYDRMIRSIPSPSGLRPETDAVALNPELPWGNREYWVDGEHSDIVEFFAVELPLADWDLVKHDRGSTRRASDVELKFDDMLFTNRHRYWLIVEVYSDVDAKGIQEDSTLNQSQDEIYMVLPVAHAGFTLASL